MTFRSFSVTTSLAAVALISACTSDPVAPFDSGELSAPSFLIGPNGEAFFVDSVDAQGNTILIQELAAGTTQNASGDFTAVASVTVRTVIPYLPAGAVSGACITSTIYRMETTPGITLSVKKPGGCDKDIQVLVEQKATRKKATFKFSMVFGKTVIDSGLLK
jgi:hypothetical protein